MQVCLVRNCWPELFVLGLAQCSRQIHIEELMVTVASSFQVDIVYGLNYVLNMDN